MQKAGMKVQCIDTDSGTDRDQMSEADSSYDRLKTFNKIVTDVIQPHDIFSDKIDYTKEKFLLIVGSRHVPDINFTDRSSRVEGILSQVKNTYLTSIAYTLMTIQRNSLSNLHIACIRTI